MWPGRKKTEEDNIYSNNYNQEEENTYDAIITFTGDSEYVLSDMSLEAATKFEEWFKNVEDKSIYEYINEDSGKIFIRKENILYVEIQ